MMMTIDFACICGARWSGKIVGSPESCSRAGKIMDVWKSEHSGKGHAPCSSKKAAWVRRKTWGKASRDRG